MKKHLFYIAITCGLMACSEDSTLDMAGMFSPNGETVNTRFEQSMAYNQTHGEISLNMGADDYVIYVCADSVLNVGGRSINDTLFITPGNHDIYFKQWQIYRSYFKTSCYWFDTNNGSKKLDLYICLDSAEGSLGTKQMKWLKDLLEAKSKEGYRRIIVMTHTHLWKLDGSQGHTSNMALEETYEITSLLGKYHVECVLSGHQHARQSVHFKGVHYIVLNATKDEEQGQSYMTVQVGEDLTYQFHPYPSH